MLSLETPILAGDIYWVQVWKTDKVFQLNGFGQDRVIVKQENQNFTTQDIVSRSYFMSAVDPGAKAIPVTPAEKSQLLTWAQANTPFPDLIPGAGELQSAINGSGNAPWIKMRAYKLVETDKAALKLGSGDKTDVRLIASILNGPGGLEKLGMIIAADFFIGNDDRFTFLDVGSGNYWPPLPASPTEQLRCTANVGNVFVTIDPEQGKGRVGGLDFLDPNAMFKLGNSNIENTEKDSIGKWLGRLLAKGESEKRMEYCYAVIEDLNLILGPRNRKMPFSCKERLPTAPSVNRLNFGMEQGAEKLLGSLRGIQNLPSNLKNRLAILGWKT